jgi:putative ABC transport system permease protein
MFNLEDEINCWKKSLRSNPSLEDGYIEELESHFRDKIEDYVNKRMSEEEAFKKAKSETGEVEKIGEEYYKTDKLPYSKKILWSEKSELLILAGNYFKIAFRMIKKYKSHSLINIAGLSIGFTVFVLIAYFVKFQFSYDKFNSNRENIYRLTTTEYATVPDLWAPGLKESFPQVQSFVRLQKFGETLIEKEANKFYDKDGLYADSTFFDIFSFDLAKGNARTALVNPNSIVITNQLSEKLFGKENPIGKTIKFFNGDSEQNYIITGLINKIPANSHFTFSFLVSESTNKAWWINNWKMHQFYTYLLLREKVNINEFTTNINILLKGKISDPNWSETAKLQKLSSIHLNSHLRGEFEINEDISTIYLFSLIALLILLIALVNYINLTTSRAVNRAKEVALRKTMGAKRSQLIFQFLGETVLLSVIVFGISIIAVELIIPMLNNLFQLKLEQNLLKYPLFVSQLLGLILIVGLLSGIYPAIVLSAYQPSAILKGTSRFSNRNFLRRILVIFQFAVTSFLIISSLLIYRQMDYINSKNIGFNKDHIITFPLRSVGITKNLDAFKNALAANANITSISFTANLPGGGDWGIPYQAEGKNQIDLPEARWLVVDQNFIPTYEMEIIVGRNFDKSIESDKNNYIINETEARELGWNNPISKKLSIDYFHRKWGDIIGVVKDFNYRSLHQRIEPLIMFIPPDNWYSNASIKVKSTDLENTISYITNTWRKFDTENPFTFSFLDNEFNKLYINDQKNMEIITILTAIAILIASLGLYSMMIHTLTSRTKEIGIRKILGAKVNSIISLVSKEIITLILIANLIASPAAYYFLSSWLQDFAYRVKITPYIFLIACILSILIAFASIIYKIIKAANTNPIKSLRYE